MEILYMALALVGGFIAGWVFGFLFFRKNPNFLKNAMVLLQAKQAKLQAVVDAVKAVVK